MIEKSPNSDEALLREELERQKVTFGITEINKTQLDALVFKDATNIISLYLQSIGLNEEISLPQENTVVIIEECPPFLPNATGFYNPPFIYIPATTKNVPRAYLEVLLHEKFHQSSAHRQAPPECIAENITLYKKKIGFSVRHEDTTGKKDDLFRVLNEAMTQMLTINSMILPPVIEYTNTNNLYPDHVTRADILLNNGAYSNEQRLLGRIIHIIYETLAKQGIANVGPDEIFHHFARGYFNGYRKHLQIIEQVYGDGALERLARIPLHEWQKDRPWSSLLPSGNEDIDFFIRPYPTKN